MDDKNQNPTPPDKTSPPTPFIVTEEEAMSPPAPAGADIPQTPTRPAGEEPQPPAMGAGEVIPPVITPPASSKKKLIGAVLAVILLLIAVPTGIFLIGQSQELRERAAGECRDNPVDPPAGYQWTATCGDEGACTGNADCPRGANNQEGWCYGFETGFRCLRLDQLTTPTPEPSCTDTSGQECLSSSECNLSGGQRGTGRCDRGLVCCVVGARATPTPTPDVGTGGPPCAELAQAGSLVRAGDGKTLGDQDVAPCNIVASFVSQWSDKAGRRWAVERTCQTENIPAANDGQAFHEQAANVVQTFIDTHGRNACQRWVDEHNREIDQPTASSCTEVRIYKHPYGQGDRVSTPYGGKVKAGDAVKFCIAGTVAAGGSPEVNVSNLGWRRAAETGPAGESCYQYDIPTDATTLSVEGRI